MNGPLARRCDVQIHADPSRVLARLFLPGEELHVAHSRVQEIVARVLDLDEAEVQRIVARLLAAFSTRHRDYEAVLAGHASAVAAHTVNAGDLSRARTLLVGASFTAEYATEGAALCNPSAMPHPDQTGLADGQLRVAISLRGIGEGHLSSIGFCSAIVGPGGAWSFSPRLHPISPGTVTGGQWHRTHLRAVLADQGQADEFTQAVLHALPDAFSSTEVEAVLGDLHPDLLSRPGAGGAAELIRRLVASAYRVEFPADVQLEQRVLMPSAAEESNGMEDARFTRFVDAAGTVEYRATYTAYDGHQIAPRLLISSDLSVFRAHRLAGPAARNKGMALFPRRIKGKYLALCRSDGESTSLSSSVDGYVWAKPQPVHAPHASWESLQVGNCGPPIETDQGWLVLTHGVGAMRTYAIGAILLDLDDPTVVVGRLTDPLLEPDPSEQDGYVPNVVYSCGGLVHDGILWLPYGIGDSRIGVAWTPLDALLGAMTRG